MSSENSQNRKAFNRFFGSLYNRRTLLTRGAAERNAASIKQQDALSYVGLEIAAMFIINP